MLATQNEGRCRQACHAKCRAATGDQRGPSAPPEPAQCHRCHACHAKRRSLSPTAKPATQSAAPPRATSGDPARHQSQASVISATPATQNEGLCRQAPGLPRKVPRRHGRPTAPKREPAQSQKRHACHAKRRRMSPHATLATQVDVAKWYVKDGVWQSCVCVCDKVVCKRWCVTKVCVCVRV